MDLLHEIDKVRNRAVADVSYDFAAGREQGVVEARAVVEKAADRVRELEDENRHLRVLEAASNTIRTERAQKDNEIIRRGQRVRELEEENQKLRDTIAARIFKEEQALQQSILKDPTNPHLNGALGGLQRARDIVNP